MMIHFTTTIPQRIAGWAGIVCLCLLLAPFTGCHKLVDPGAPINTINERNVFAKDETAIAAITGLYAEMSAPGLSGTYAKFTGSTGFSVLCGLSADELTLYSQVSDPRFIAYYQNKLVASTVQESGSEFWLTLFNQILKCNQIIDGVNQSTTLTPAVKQQIAGEARFLRAFHYFYLINLYGEVPLLTGTDLEVNLAKGKSSVAEVYVFIAAELQEAKNLLSEEFLDGTLLQPTTERLRPTKWAAAALLARVALYMGDFETAEQEASVVIDSEMAFSLPALSDAFLATSQEAIWQLQPVVFGHNTEDGWTFILPESGPSDINFGQGNPVYLSETVTSAFEPDDQRPINWIGSVTAQGSTYYFPRKYKSATFGDPVTEYAVVLRLAEQLLIRAEARTHLGDFSGAQNDLNLVRGRAGLGSMPASNEPGLVAAIMHERQAELFTEWGHRWLDLKRTGQVDAVMTVAAQQKGSEWSGHQALYPVPTIDIQRSPIGQNEGY